MDLADNIRAECSGEKLRTDYSHVSASLAQIGLLAKNGYGLGDVDWRQNALTADQAVYCADVLADGPWVLKNLFSDMKRGLAGDGVCVVSLGEELAASPLTVVKQSLTLLTSAAFRPFGAFKASGFWTQLGGNANAEKMGAHSTGYIPFHFDLDQASAPPRYVGLFCVREDPYGGGANLFADYKRVFGRLSGESFAALKEITFSFSGLYGTHNIGVEQNPHPLIDGDILGSGAWMCRYNGKARPQFADGSKMARVFDALESVFRDASREVVLRSGDLVLMDQSRVLHARQPLAKRPAGVRIPAAEDRLLLQVYGKSY